MGFKEIAMIVVALILAGILGLSVAPSISASGVATTTSMLNSEFESVISAGKLWVVNNSGVANFNGITSQGISGNIPNLTRVGTGATSTLSSKVKSGISYQLASGQTTAADDSIVVTISGLSIVTNAETNLKTTIANKYGLSAITDTTAGDGVLIIKVHG